MINCTAIDVVANLARLLFLARRPPWQAPPLHLWVTPAQLATLSMLSLVSCTGVEVHDCVNGRDGVEVAAAYAAEHWPDAKTDAEFLLVSCKPQDIIETSISSCGLSPVQRPESCAVHKAAPGRPARIDISHDEDAAISTCHELQHLRDAVWFTPDGCQSHEMSCGYDADSVAECERSVYEFRGN